MDGALHGGGAVGAWRAEASTDSARRKLPATDADDTVLGVVSVLDRTHGVGDPLAVDLGYGRLPVTTLEFASRLRSVAPGVRVVGLEIDPEKVEQARHLAGMRGERARARGARVGVATVRVQKPGEERIDAHLARLAPDHVLRALDVLLAQRKTGKGTVRTPADYTMPNVSQKVLRILLSYTDYVNRTVWHK